jgi:D-beta-D-heptose 7-phosphate kinase/D-beta-D-heptose 1-phosphate adenosyltransferase
MDENIKKIRSNKNLNKVRSLEAALPLISDWRKEGLKIGFTNGCFDLLHPGHVWNLQECKDRCDKLVVGLDTDISVKRLKGADRPIYNQEERAILLSALSSVDLIIFFTESVLDLIIPILPDMLIKGGDYQKEQILGYKEVTEAGGSVHLVEHIGFSTSKTIAKIKQLD